jgi:hypothetical protein
MPGLINQNYAILYAGFFFDYPIDLSSDRMATSCSLWAGGVFVWSLFLTIFSGVITTKTDTRFF